MRGVSIIVPVYKSETCLSELCRRLKASMETISHEFEIILVEDCGGDRSWGMIVELSRLDERIKGIQLSRNFGQHNALVCGIRAAKYDVIVTLDDDLQHPPEEIPKLLKKLAEGYDVVYGTPQKEEHSLWRHLASQITKVALQSTMGAETARKVSAFRAFRTQAGSSISYYEGPFVSVDVLLTWGTTRFSSIPVRHDPRRIGTSHYTFRMLVSHALNMMTGFSMVPLQLASLVGFVFTLFGLGALIFVVGRYLIQGESVPGFPFLASIISIFAGAQLFALGIIGEYLARMHFRMMGRPTYAVRRSTFQSQKTKREG